MKPVSNTQQVTGGCHMEVPPCMSKPCGIYPPYHPFKGPGIHTKPQTLFSF